MVCGGCVVSHYENIIVPKNKKIKYCEGQHTTTTASKERARERGVERETKKHDEKCPIDFNYVQTARSFVCLVGRSVGRFVSMRIVHRAKQKCRSINCKHIIKSN